MALDLKKALENAPKTVETKTVDKDAWNRKKEEMAAIGRVYTPIWLPARAVEVAKTLAKRLRCKYEDILAAVLTSAENYKVFADEMAKVVKAAEK
jgi:phage terminase small subunit